jgi:hypothetical protein
MATEREILSALSSRQQQELARLLRATLIGLGDRAEPVATPATPPAGAEPPGRS